MTQRLSPDALLHLAGTAVVSLDAVSLYNLLRNVYRVEVLSVLRTRAGGPYEVILGSGAEAKRLLEETQLGPRAVQLKCLPSRSCLRVSLENCGAAVTPENVMAVFCYLLRANAAEVFREPPVERRLATGHVAYELEMQPAMLCKAVLEFLAAEQRPWEEKFTVGDLALGQAAQQ